MQALKDKKSRVDALLWILTALLFAAAIIPTWTKYLPMGHDVIYHCQRIMNIAADMKLGNFFPLVYSHAMDGMGYGAPLFYADLFMYPYAALHALGLSIHTTFKLLQSSLLMLTFLSMYLCAKSIFRNHRQSMVAALAYAFSFYGLMDVYFRAAIGECFGFIFLPVVYLGYYDITHDRPHRWWMLALGMAGILFSHTLSVLLAAVMLVVLMLFDAKYWLKNLARIRYLVYAALLCVGISCCFWLPMLEQMTQLSFRLNMDMEGVESFLTKLQHPFRVILPVEVLAVLRPTIQHQFPRVGSMFAYFALLLAVIALWRGKKWQSAPLLGAFVLFLWMSGDYSPSRWLAPLLAVLQFAYRFLLPVCLLMALLIGFGYGGLQTKRGRGLMTVLVLICSLASVVMIWPETLYASMEQRAADLGMTPTEFIESNLNYNEVSDGQYLPYDLTYVKNEWGDYIHPTFDAKASDENISFEMTRNAGNELCVSFSGNPGGAYIDVPIILYIGYEVTDETGAQLPISRGECGMIRVELGDAESGSFTVHYAGTKLQALGRGVTAASALAFAAILLRRKRRLLSK